MKFAILPLLTLAIAAQAAVPAARKAAPAPALKADPVLAQIGKKAVHQSDFETFLELVVPPQQRPLVASAPDVKARYLQQFLDFNVLAAKAKQDRLDASPAFQRKLALREQETLVQELMQRDGELLQKQIQPSDEALKAYFEANKEKFKTPEKYSARHILIGTKPQGAPAEAKGLSDEEAKAKTGKLLAELKGGKKIEDLAKDYSDDPGSKEKGGLYEDIAYGQFVPEFEATVKKQAPGEISEPVKTQYGYHIIQVVKKTPSEMPDFEKVKDRVKQAWMPHRQEEVFRKYIDDAKKGLSYMDKSKGSAQ